MVWPNMKTRNVATKAKCFAAAVHHRGREGVAHLCGWGGMFSGGGGGMSVEWGRWHIPGKLDFCPYSDNGWWGGVLTEWKSHPTWTAASSKLRAFLDSNKCQQWGTNGCCSWSFQTTQDLGLTENIPTMPGMEIWSCAGNFLIRTQQRRQDDVLLCCLFLAHSVRLDAKMSWAVKVSFSWVARQ